MYLLIIFFPLISSILSLIFFRFIGALGSFIILISFMILELLVSFFLCFEVGFSHSLTSIKLLSWFDVGYFYVNWGFLFDSLTVIMLIVVNLISLLVHIYSLEYMKEDPHLPRFMVYLTLFTWFMIILITSDNFLQLFLGWEGVGLVSYLLINFWFTRKEANKSALKAVIVNRIGDFGLIFGLSLIFLIFKSLNFYIIYQTSYYYQFYFLKFFFFNINIFDIISYCLIIGAVGKSAQIGLHVWLPDAMEGPTPVSALIHAATMVTAGIFTLLRSSYILEYSNSSLILCCIFGSITSFMASTIGLFQNDLKKIIAYSTCSQLGYMMFTIGLSNYHLTLFHLYNHAFFKALLFLSAGSVIHALNNEQDLRKMGGLFKIMPLTYIFFIIGSLALIGFPFLSGFYSKDLILEISFIKYDLSSMFSFILGLLTVGITSFYSFKLLILTFLIKSNSFKKVVENVHEPKIFMLLPLFILSFFSLFIGFISHDFFIGLGSDFWNGSLLFNTNISNIEAEFINNNIKLLPFFFTIFGLILSFIIYFNNYYLLLIYYKVFFIKNIYTFFNKKWYFDTIYYYFIILPLLNFGYFITYKLIDRGIIELFGPLGIVRIFNLFSIFISKIQSSLIYKYFFLFLIYFLIINLIFF